MELNETTAPEPRKISKILILLIIVLVAAVLIALIFPMLINIKPMTLSTQTLIKNLEEPLQEFAMRHPYSRYPEASSEEGGNGTSILVSELIEGNYFKFYDTNLTSEKPSQLVDEWGNPMRYHPWKNEAITENAHNRYSYDLWSAGADGEFGTDDDITNWAVTIEEVENDRAIPAKVN